MNSSKHNSADAIWDFFCSVKLSITTLILLATTSILGTVIEQGSTPEAMAQKLDWNLSTLPSCMPVSLVAGSAVAPPGCRS